MKVRWHRLKHKQGGAMSNRRIYRHVACLFVCGLMCAWLGCRSDRFEDAPTAKAPPSGPSKSGSTSKSKSSDDLPPSHPPITGRGSSPGPVANNSNRSAGRPDQKTDRGRGQQPKSGGTTEFPVQWQIPDSWKKVETSSRLKIPKVEFRIPGSNGTARMKAFYFGPGQGGSVDANLNRWKGQFEAGKGRKKLEPERSSKTVNGIEVHTLDVTGTFSPSMPRGKQRGATPGTRMLAAIAKVEGKKVFFKLVGPKQTVRAAKSDFDAFVSSLKPVAMN